MLVRGHRFQHFHSVEFAVDSGSGDQCVLDISSWEGVCGESSVVFGMFRHSVDRHVSPLDGLELWL